METMLSNYIDDMKAYIAPVNAGAMMRVDRNDISYNISQIADGILTVNEIAYDSGSSFPDYKHFLWNRSTEEARLILEEEERERIRREKNYNTFAAFRSGSVSRAFCIFREELEEIQHIYKESIVPFENTDDDYADQARFYYDMWETIGNKWDSLKETTSNAVRGVFDAGVEALDGALSFALYLAFGGFVFSGVVSLPDEVEERVRGIDAGMQAMLKDPFKSLEALGQSATDTYEEEGLAYAIGYLGLDVVVDILAAKGLKKVKGTAKAADTADDAAEAARKAQRAAENTRGAESAIDDIPLSGVDDALSEIEKFYDDMYERQNYVDASYEEFLEDLRNVRAETIEGGLDVKIKPSNSYNIDAKPSGTATKITDKMDDATKRSLMRENEAAETIAKNGYNIEQNPVVEGTTRNPDYIIEGEIFDCYSPAENTKIRNVASTIEEKVIQKGQTERVVLNLDDWKGDIDALVKQLNDYPIEGLKEVIVVYDGNVQSIYP